MSISPSLQASARSAYRNLLRASASTFSGDETVLRAFRLKMRTQALEAQSTQRAEAISASVALAHEMAVVLRKNVVQAVKVSEADAGNQETWKLRLTKDTELGSNDTINNPNQKRPDTLLEQTGNSTEGAVEKSHAAVPKAIWYFSALKRAHKERCIPELREDELEESFVRGSGPGGQSINKTQNNVQILHIPTGLRVSCQETRSLEINRRLARRLMVEKLDKIQNPGLSKGDLERAKQRERERRRRKKAKKRDAEKRLVNQSEPTDRSFLTAKN